MSRVKEINANIDKLDKSKEFKTACKDAVRTAYKLCLTSEDAVEQLQHRLGKTKHKTSFIDCIALARKITLI